MTELGDIYDGPVPMSWHPIRDHDMVRESYCLTCGCWETRYPNGLVCTECGHTYPSVFTVKAYALQMEQRGYPPLPFTQCPFCAGELQ